MIYSLRKKFIKISAISIFIVFSAIFAGIAVMNHIQLNDTMDTLTDAISHNGGAFPEIGKDMPPRKKPFERPEIITEETKFSTRFFTVWMNSKNEIIDRDTDSVSSVDDEQSEEYAHKAIKENRERGWISSYRYKVFNHPKGKALVFVNGEMNRIVSHRFLFVSFLVLLCSGIVLLMLLVVMSKKVVSPIAESYEKQKQFITDANHELKTPLALIMSNVDIVETEFGKSDWLDDIRSEGQRMGKLINHMVSLSRMDEEQNKPEKERFNLSKTVREVLETFSCLAKENGLVIAGNIVDDIYYKGNQQMIRQLLSVLLDNAVKYCDNNGHIFVGLSGKHTAQLTVENTYADADNLELDKLFDRFYRADKARTYDGSFGIGLSLAKEIVSKHGGEISAYRKENIIGFKVELKQ